MVVKQEFGLPDPRTGWYYSAGTTITVVAPSVLKVVMHNDYPAVQGLTAWFAWQARLDDSTGHQIALYDIYPEANSNPVVLADHDAHAYFKVSPGTYKISLLMGKQSPWSIATTFGESAFVEFQAVTISP